MEEPSDSPPQTATNSAAELLKQGAGAETTNAHADKPPKSHRCVDVTFIYYAHEDKCVCLLLFGSACNVWYLGSVELESLTGHQAVQKATTLTLSADPPPASTAVHFKVSAQGITLTDNQRK